MQNIFKGMREYNGGQGGHHKRSWEQKVDKPIFNSLDSTKNFLFQN